MLGVTINKVATGPVRGAEGHVGEVLVHGFSRPQAELE